MKISVIIPTYKPQVYLWECLDSISKQTFPKEDFEVILILNGCCEPFNSQILQYIRNHSDIQWNYIQTNETGVSNARNIGLNNATGEYITFIDDDDFISPSYLKSLYSLSSKDTMALCYPLSFIDGTVEYRPYYITQDYLKNEQKGVCDYNALKKYFSGPVYKLIHREIIGNRRFDKRFKNGEDTLFMFLISDRFDKVKLADRNAIYYRRLREDGALHKKKSFISIITNCFNLIREYCHIYFNNPQKYRMKFFFTRILGTLHAAFEQLIIQMDGICF